MLEALFKLLLEIVCGTLGHVVTRIFGRKNPEIDLVDELVGFVILLAIIGGAAFIVVQFFDIP